MTAAVSTIVTLYLEWETVLRDKCVNSTEVTDSNQNIAVDIPWAKNNSLDLSSAVSGLQRCLGHCYFLWI